MSKVALFFFVLMLFVILVALWIFSPHAFEPYDDGNEDFQQWKGL